jgi:hypothetical protein
MIKAFCRIVTGSTFPSFQTIQLQKCVGLNQRCQILKVMTV